MERRDNCETCRHNHGTWCGGEACFEGDAYEPIRYAAKRCRFCGGELSRLRTDGKRYWRHCFSCFHEVPEAGPMKYDHGDKP